MKFPTPPQALEKDNLTQLNHMMEEAAVKNFLLNNPDFLHTNPQLLAHLDLSHEVEDATSLVERQIKVLRERNQSLQGQLIEMLHAAYNNENLLIQCNQFMLDLLGYHSLQALTTNIIQKLKQDFQLDNAALILVGNFENASPAQVMSDAAEIKTLFNCQFPDNQTLCGRLEEAPKKALFGDFGRELESFALVPLGEGCDQGILALASKDVDRFEPQMGTLFVELIAKVIAHLVSRYESK